jgi:hypothetical protein
MSATTGWVKRPHQAKGQDPLGVQAPCINIYQQLMPGITNVTDRARYYSFYPWLVWAAEQTQSSRTVDEFVDWIRKGDCLFTMIAVRHRLVSGDDDVLRHDARLIGTQTLRSVVAAVDGSEPIDLSVYATREDGDPNRYFKNRLGGLGQYYLGTLTELGLMGRLGRVVGYSRLGERAARAMDGTVDRELFVDTLSHGQVTPQRLDQLSAFCPCGLLESPDEQELLVELLFGPDIPGDASGSHRRDSLLLNLDLISGVGGSQEFTDYDERVFRAATYSGTLPSGQAWESASTVAAARESWAAYEANELLSYAVQCVFWVALRSLEESGVPVSDTAALGDWFAGSEAVHEAVEELGAGSFHDSLEAMRRKLPKLSDMGDENHELALTAALEAAVGNDAPSSSEVLGLAGRLMLTLCGREPGNDLPYGSLSFPVDYFEAHPISLLSLRNHVADDWSGLSLRDWYGWMASRWGAEAHLRVALRKLRSQSRDTFHIMPTDSGLKVIAEPIPTFTTPRFATTTQVLQDLGVTARTPDGKATRLTDLGRSLRA